MADESRSTARDLTELESRLSAEPWKFDFFQAVRRLESAAPDSPRVGTARSVDEEIVRFGQQPTLAFESSSLSRYEPASGDDAARMLVSFMGLLGPNGPMPLHLTEFAVEWARGRCERLERLQRRAGSLSTTTVGGDSTSSEEREREYDRISRFFDIFHHRLLSLFYRAWAHHQQTVSSDRAADDSFATYVASLIGYGGSTFSGLDSLGRSSRLQYAGHLASQSRCPEGLEAILEDYFGVKARVVEFVGHWLEVPPHCRTRIGHMNCRLGEDAILGSRVRDSRSKFRLRLGPMSLEELVRLLPGQPAYRRLTDWVRNYVCEELSWDVQYVLAGGKVPAVRLGRSGRLGLTAWLCPERSARDRDDLVVDPVTYS